MKTLQQMREVQDKLDAQETICPHCKKPEKWFILRDWGACSECQRNDSERYEQAFGEEESDPDIKKEREDALADEYVPPHFEPEEKVQSPKDESSFYEEE